MCGITGFFSLTPQPAKIAGQMTDLIRHRGPDDEGFVLFGDLSAKPLVCGGEDTPDDAYRASVAYAPKAKFGNFSDYPAMLALGHRRLSIVDVSPLGHQPMSSADERYWIVFNGEVYNHVELRAELENIGHRFVSHSDTEVIIAAYREWGRACLSRFNGMFAFLIYDREQNTLFVARDRFGIKPLYYRISAHGIAFASEIKQFTVLPDWQAAMNGQRVYDFLNWGITDHTEETMFADIFQLRGGEALELNLRNLVAGQGGLAPGGRLPTYRWYELRAQSFRGNMEEATEQFRTRFTDAVRLHLRADVPVGSCLSGGLDSSSIVCVMNSILQESGAHALQRTFSACADIKRFDEREFIDDVVRHTDVEGHYVYPELANLFTTCESIIWHQDEPFGSTSIYAQWEVFRLAAQNGVKVMLDGQGADEQLAGYHSYFGSRLSRLFKTFHWLEFYQEMSAIHAVHGYPVRWGIQQALNNLLPEVIRQPLRKFVGKSNAVVPNWLNVNALGAKTGDPFRKNAEKINSVEDLSYLQLTSSNLQMLLHWEDRDSMAHSIESRVPFLDYRLVEFVLGLPEEFKIKNGITKRVLREGMKGILPETIRNRMDKLGFVTPEEVWLRERSPDQFRQALKDAVNSSRGILNENANVLLEKMISGEVPFNFLIWRLISFGAWMRVFFVK